MNYKYRYWFSSYLFLIIFSGLIFVLCYGLGRYAVTFHSIDKVVRYPIRIVCTTGMIADAARIVGADYVTVTSLMGSGVDPHIYRPRESDVRLLSSADIILYNGLSLEGRMEELFEAMSKYLPTVPVGEAVPIEFRRATNFELVVDPHVWHDVTLWMFVVDRIGSVLAERDPAHAAIYRYNVESYCKELKKLDYDIRKMVSTIPPERRYLLTAHDAFEYFGAAYGLTVVGLQGISTDAEVSIAEVRNMANYIIDKKVPALFLENSISPRGIRALQDAVRARGWHVAIGKELFSDSLGDAVSGGETYSSMIRHNVAEIVHALTESVNDVSATGDEQSEYN